VARKPQASAPPPKSPRPAPAGDRESVSVRKIANGYVTTRLGSRDGKFFKQESFSRKQPVVTAAAPKAQRRGPDDEVGFLNRGR
jgi:hypothetical protein